jgi:serine/threonine-protein kinase
MDHRVDLYATGVILYESVTGQVPFNADTFNELLFKIVLEEPRPIEQLVPEIDRNFAAIINKAMARERSTRFQTAKEFQQALEQWANGAGAELANAFRLPAARPNAESTGQYAARQAAQAQQAPLLGTGTPGNWSNTGGVATQLEVPPKKSKVGLFAALGAVAVIAVVGAVVGMRAGKADASTAAAAAGSDRIADEKAKAESLAAAAKAQQAEADLKAEEARKADEDKKAAAAKAAAEASQVVVAPGVADLPKVKAVAGAQVHAAARPPAVAKEAPKAAPAAAAPAPAPTATGRKIRTSL